MHKCIGTGTHISLYADDTKIWREIVMDSDHMMLQRDIDALYRWSQINRMKFHPDKCKVLVVTLKRVQHILPFDRFGYHLNGTYLDYVESEKDLGVIVHGNLSWGTQCKNLISKANQRLGLVRRTCHFTKCSKQRRVLYLALVRSIFEHCSPIWHPHHTTHLEMFQKLQRRAVKWILGEPLSSYSDNEFLRKQNILDLLPLRSKFVLTDLVLFHRIVYKSIDIDMPEYVKLLTPSMVSNTRAFASVASSKDNLTYKCTVKTRVDVFKFSFFPRTVKAWNDLPVAIREITDPIDFTSDLKEHLWILLGVKPD